MNRLPPLGDEAILEARGPREESDPERLYALLLESEIGPSGRVEDVAALFISNHECPFRCLVCDLWKYTSERAGPSASVAAQVASGLERFPAAPVVKLYNAGSFFDDGAIPPEDRAQIATLLEGRERVIIECHPRLVDERCLAFAEAIAPVKLEVALGLETVDPELIPRLNKAMTLGDFERAVALLHRHDIRVRAFVLLGPPGHRGDEAVRWAERSVEYAFGLGVECCVVIPVRPGNGIVDELERQGHYARPSLTQLESVLTRGLRRGQHVGGQRRVFVDLWDVEDFFDCQRCGPERAEALQRANCRQTPVVSIGCRCGSALE